MTLALGALARLPGLFKHSTIPDEAFTFFIASHPFSGIVALLRAGDFHPPLVYAIGHALFAVTPRAYLFRIVTFIFGMIGVAASYALARRILGRWAWIAAVLVAINPVLAFFDGYFRMYALLWSLCALSWACLLWCLDEPARPGRWGAYWLVVTALIYTQYLAFFTIAGEIAYVAIFYRRALGFWVATASALICFLPWLPTLLVQYPLGGTAFNDLLSAHLTQLLYVPSALLLDGLPQKVAYNAPIVALFWIVVIAGFVCAAIQRRWALLAMLFPIVLQAAYALVSGKLFLGQRYLLQAVVPVTFAIVVLCAWVWTTRVRPLVLAALTGLTLMEATASVDKHVLSQYMPLDWTQYGHFLDDKIQPNDAVLFDGSMAYYPLVGTKAAAARPLYLVSDPDQAAALGAQAARPARVWYVGYETQLSDPHEAAIKAIRRTHPHQTTWVSTGAGYDDVVLTILFERSAGARGRIVRSAPHPH